MGLLSTGGERERWGILFRVEQREKKRGGEEQVSSEELQA